MPVFKGKPDVLGRGETTIQLDGILTNRMRSRRKFDDFRRRIVVAGSVILAAAVLAGAQAETRPAFQPVADIETTAARFVEQRISDTSASTTVQASRLDPRIRLHLCEKPLEGFLRPGTQIQPRTLVGVRCSGIKPWKVYVPVNLSITAQVLTPGRTLRKGHLINTDDLVADTRDVSRLREGFYTDPAELVGQRVAFTVTSGQVITPRMVEADKVIRRGQAVTLVAKNGTLSISMGGKALSDGALGHRIEVENTNSGRVVEGIVRSPEHVEVLTTASSGFFSEKPKVTAPVADIRLNQQ